MLHVSVVCLASADNNAKAAGDDEIAKQQQQPKMPPPRYASLPPANIQLLVQILISQLLFVRFCIITDLKCQSSSRRRNRQTAAEAATAAAPFSSTSSTHRAAAAAGFCRTDQHNPTRPRFPHSTTNECFSRSFTHAIF